MKKIISFILLSALLLACFSGCAGLNTNDNDDKNDSGKIDLNDMFNILEKDAARNNKIFFYISREDLHNELKDSGLYNDSRWQPSGFQIYIECNFENASDEDWYKQCSDTDTKSLNEAFYSSISSTLTNGEFSNIVFSPGVHLGYSSADDLYADYLDIKSLTDLEYVTTITIGYHYGLPYDYMAE